MARPSKYKAEYAEQVKKLCDLGATDVQLADFFGVALSTLNLWKLKHPKFSESLKIGKEIPDNKVEMALYQRAIGYSHPDTDIRVIDGEIVQTELVKHYPPDTRAALAWLYNRKGENWHPLPQTPESEEVPPTEIHFHVKEAVAEIKTTNAKS